MKYQFIAEYAHEHSVALMCKVLHASRSGYYAFLLGRVGARAQANRVLLEEIRAVHACSRETYGSPRVFQELRAQGIACGRHRVARLMAHAGIVARVRHRYRTTTRQRANATYAPDRLQRSFVAQHPHQIWTSDITYVWTAEGWLYLAVVMDLYSRMIVGWATGSRIDAGLVCNALSRALVRHRPTSAVILHSDRGSQYTSQALQMLLAKNQPEPLVPSHGLSCYDNAVMESFFHTLKTECVHFERYVTREEGHRSLFDYIEVFYNRQRRHSSLAYRTPAETEELFNRTQRT
jgi:transposase InsO family protein